MRRLLLIVSALVLLTAMLAAADPLAATDDALVAGIQQSSSTWSANANDFDGDGDNDFMLVRHNRIKEANGATATLYRNEPTGFVEQRGFGIADRHDCAWGDVDNDGRPDMFCSIGANNGTADKANELWMQQGDGSFEEQALQFGVDDIHGRGRYSTFVDVNHDEFPDLFLGNFYPRKDGIPSPNRLFINEGGTAFRDAPEYGLDNEVGAFCAQTVDYDNDGWEDLLVCGKKAFKLYHNDEGLGFTNVAADLNLTGNIWLFAVMTDFNGDGLEDLARIKINRLQVKLQTTNGLFSTSVINRAVPAGESLAVGDVNRDGFSDLYVVKSCIPGTPGNVDDEMLVNNGLGTGFTAAVIPQAGSGCGDVAEAIDYNSNGADDFIVLNGDEKSIGPLQLISFP